MISRCRPNEQRLLKAAHLMVSNLAGALALVTCKEPLRLSMSNHLRQLLSGSTDDAVVLEQVAVTCSQENLELGCLLIEKAATEKVFRPFALFLRDSHKTGHAGYQ